MNHALPTYEYVTCPECNGSGIDPKSFRVRNCPDCAGYGEIHKDNL